jgi:hypothetical protein
MELYVTDGGNTVLESRTVLRMVSKKDKSIKALSVLVNLSTDEIEIRIHSSEYGTSFSGKEHLGRDHYEWVDSLQTYAGEEPHTELDTFVRFHAGDNEYQEFPSRGGSVYMEVPLTDFNAAFEEFFSSAYTICRMLPERDVEFDQLITLNMLWRTPTKMLGHSAHLRLMKGK